MLRSLAGVCCMLGLEGHGLQVFSSPLRVSSGMSLKYRTSGSREMDQGPLLLRVHPVSVSKQLTTRTFLHPSIWSSQQPNRTPIFIHILQMSP